MSDSCWKSSKENCCHLLERILQVGRWPWSQTWSVEENPSRPDTKSSSSHQTSCQRRRTSRGECRELQTSWVKAKQFWVKLLIYNVNSFSSLIACHLVRLDEQFFSSAVEIFLGQRWFNSPPPRKLARTRMAVENHSVTPRMVVTA